MNRIFFFLLAVMTLPGRTSPISSQAVDQLVDEEMKRYGIVGLSLGVVHKGRVVVKKSYGFASVEHAVPATPATMYQLSSSSKIFAATAAMVLLEEGKLALDQSVREYLPNLVKTWQPVTIRHLMSHLSGLPDVLQCEADTYQEALACVSGAKLLNIPGERFFYNQTNYMLLVAIIEKLSGQSFVDFVGSRVFEPASMTQTVYAGSVFQMVPGRATSYYPDGEGGVRLRDFQFPSFHYGGAGLNSSLEDLIRWQAALLGGRIIRKETLQTMWQEPVRNDGSISSYGLGWDIQHHGSDTRSAGHEGGGLTTFRYFFDKDLSVIVLTNGMTHRFNPESIAERVADIYAPGILGPAARLTQAMMTALESGHREGAQRAYLAFTTSEETRDLDTEGQINSLGYQLMGLGFHQHAVWVLELNTKRYPQSANTFDSLGEAHLGNGNKQAARINYRKVLAMEPENRHAAEMLERLK